MAIVWLLFIYLLLTIWNILIQWMRIICIVSKNSVDFKPSSAAVFDSNNWKLLNKWKHKMTLSNHELINTGYGMQHLKMCWHGSMNNRVISKWLEISWHKKEFGYFMNIIQFNKLFHRVLSAIFHCHCLSIRENFGKAFHVCIRLMIFSNFSKRMQPKTV